MPRAQTPGWVYLGDSGGEPFAIQGVNIFKYEWIPATDRASVDLVYGRDLIQLDVYRVIAGGKDIRFAAGEFANNAWAFCVPSGT